MRRVLGMAALGVGLLGVGLLGLLLAGCGSQTTARRPARPRPIAEAQALELARVLVGDYRHGGSRLAGTYTVQGQQLDFTGAIDFPADAGRLSLRQASLPAHSARTFFWTRKLVLAQAAPGSRDYLVASINPQGSPISHLVSFLDLLSAPLIDNLQQLEGVGIDYLGSADGLDRFRYGRMVLSVRHATGLLAAVAINAVDGTRITVSLLSHAPLRIALPPRSRWREAKK